MVISTLVRFELSSLTLLIPIGLIIVTAVVLSVLAAKTFGTGNTGSGVISIIGLCALLPILDLLSGIVGDWDGMENVFKAMIFGPPLAIAIGWPVIKLIQVWRRRREQGEDNQLPQEGRPDEQQPDHRTDHLVKIVAKGRGNDRRVEADCQECPWSAQRTGLGSWPDRHVRELAMKHSTRVVGGVRHIY